MDPDPQLDPQYLRIRIWVLQNWIRGSESTWTRSRSDPLPSLITGFVSQETEITLPKLGQRGHKLFNVTNSTKSQNQHLTNTQDNHTIFYKSDITSTAKTNIHLSKNLIQNYKFLRAQLNIHAWNAIQHR